MTNDADVIDKPEYARGFRDGWKDAKTRASFYSIFPDESSAGTFPRSKDKSYLKGYWEAAGALSVAVDRLEPPETYNGIEIEWEIARRERN